MSDIIFPTSYVVYPASDVVFKGMFSGKAQQFKKYFLKKSVSLYLQHNMTIMIHQISFRINYHTVFGQTVAVIVSSANSPDMVLTLSPQGDDIWEGSFAVDLRGGSVYHYQYIVFENNRIVSRETAFPKRAITAGVRNNVRCLGFQDIWRYDIRQINYGKSAFTNCIFNTAKRHKKLICNNKTLFCVHLLTPPSKDFDVLITGESDTLGNWNPGRGVKMTRYAVYGYAAETDSITTGTQYKYVVKYKGEVLWENGENRSVNIGPKQERCIINDGWVRMPDFTDWHGAGIVVPLFSLHSKDSNGIGDFADLKRFIKWASEVGFSAIQLLPINDTTTFGSWKDSYPYNSVSAFALNPIYISLKEAGYNIPSNINRKELPFVDYEETFKLKMQALAEIYKSEKHKLKDNVKFANFKKNNKSWLMPYSVYCALRDKYNTLEFSKWDGLETYDANKIKGEKNLLSKAEFYQFVQFLAFSQMKSAQIYAHKKRVILKGDIPIGVNLHSCDVWENPKFFNRDMSTGAPPDYFSEDGQNWGFPTYNWQEMEKDGYSWWKARLKVMADFFDAYRIDHVLGFFRIWEIPRSQTSAKYGHFSPALPYSEKELNSFGFCLKKEHIGTLFFEDRLAPHKYHPAIYAHGNVIYQSLDDRQKHAYDMIHNDFFGSRNENLWEKEGTEKLREITNATNMLACAEDLGMLPSCITGVLGKLGILSLEIQNMPKQSGVEFADVSKYPYNSVATISTHDMPSFRLWWKRFPESASRYAEKVLGMFKNIPAEADESICTQVVMQHLNSPSMLCLLSFQDWTAICEDTRSKDLASEQINDPANSSQYWRYKTHLSLEELEKSTLLKKQILEMVSETKRNLFA